MTEWFLVGSVVVGALVVAMLGQYRDLHAQLDRLHDNLRRLGDDIDEIIRGDLETLRHDVMERHGGPAGRVLVADSGETFEILRAGSTLLDNARAAGVSLSSQCGGRRRCGLCRVTVLKSGEMNARHPEETARLGPQAGSNERLGCCLVVSGDLEIRRADQSSL